MPIELLELRPRDGIRFAVGSADSRHGATFRFWGDRKGDFYLAVRSLGGILKTSVHRDGRCHTGFTREYADSRLFPLRHLDRWTEPLDRLTHALHVMVAEQDLSEYPADVAEPMRWLRPPRVDHASLVAVVIAPTAEAQQFAQSMEESLASVDPVGVIVTTSRTAYLIHTEVALTEDRLTQLADFRNRIQAEALSHGVTPAPGLRAIGLGESNVGERPIRFLQDFAFDRLA